MVLRDVRGESCVCGSCVHQEYTQLIVTQGLGGNQLVLRGFGENATHTNYVVAAADLHEGIPATTFLLEGISSIYGTKDGVPVASFSLEGVPGRGPAQDGAWTEVGSDGAWTEPPLAGAYTQDNSYIKEYKEASFFTKEGVPS